MNHATNLVIYQLTDLGVLEHLYLFHTIANLKASILKNTETWHSVSCALR